MKPARSRRVQAQRKFAQGAYVPPNVPTAVVTNVDRRDAAQDTRNVFVNRVPAATLLDLISLQGVHHHLQPVVLLERMRGRNNINRDLAHNREKESDRHREKELNNKKPKLARIKKTKPSKRLHVMSLRSRRHSKLIELKKIAFSTRSSTRQAVKGRNILQREKPPRPKKKCLNLKDPRLESAEFSLDDNRPLKYFAKCSTPKAPALPVLQPPGPAAVQPLAASDILPPVVQPHAALVEQPRPIPILQPLASPIIQPLASSIIQPLAPPIIQPLDSPVKQPLTSPVIQPLASPIIQPLASPIIQPLASPIIQPHDTPVVPPCVVFPEPVAGPSGLQRVINITDSPRNLTPSSSMRSAYYSEHNIHRWMNDSLTPDSRKSEEHSDFCITVDDSVKMEDIEPVPCPATRWVSVKDVIDAPQHELDSRCNICEPCARISKLIKLSTLLKTQIKTDITGEEYFGKSRPRQTGVSHNKNDAMVSTDGDNSYLYLELIPKHPGFMIKLRSHVVHGTELLSACLIPRADARNNCKEFLLQEQEHLLDQLNETLMLSRREHKTSGRTTIATVDSYHSDESDIITCDPVKVARIREYKAKKRVKTRKLLEAEARMKVVAQSEARIKAEKEAAEAAEARIQAERKAEAERLRIKKELEEARLMAEVDAQAKILENEKDAKAGCSSNMGHASKEDGHPGGTPFPDLMDAAQIVDAPEYRPTEEEFKNPIAYFEKIRPVAHKYGICKVIPPEGWKPKCKIPLDLRFDVTNQYISRMYSRWGPAARELCAIKLCLKQQNVSFTRLPLIDGVEVNLPKLYHLVQSHGGLENVINKKKWTKVAEEMKFSKTSYTEKRLDQIYVKYLLPYDTLAHQERQDIMRKVEKAWNRKNQKLLDRALNPLYRQKRMLGESESSDEEIDDDDGTSSALAEAEDCVVPGFNMNLTKFKKIAANTYEKHFGQRPANAPPSVEEIEEEYWRFVLLGTEHLCVNTASIDTGDEGLGFTKNRSEPYGSHPWNLKMFSENSGNMLRYLGPVLGLTVPTLHLGMLFSTSCWHKDPHCVAWTEYLHNGSARIWYGIPASQTDNFRKAVETLAPMCCQNKWMWLPSDSAMIPPHILRDHNVSMSRAVQKKNEFILAFPKSYSCSIGTGYSESESVYFAPDSWLEDLPYVFQEARQSCEPTMFSYEQLLLRMSQDTRVEPEILMKIKPLLLQTISQELNNRRVLQEKGLKLIYEKSVNARRKRQTGAWNVAEQEECEFCRTVLYLSKVKGVMDRRSLTCLSHSICMLDSGKYNGRNVAQMEVVVYVSTRELNNIADGVVSRLEPSTS